MLALLSPSKTLDMDSALPTKMPDMTQPDYLDEAHMLARTLRRYRPQQLMELMDISAKLADVNAARWKQFTLPQSNARPALLTFKGDVYEGMTPAHYTRADFTFAQRHVRILSGLYGLLRPLDAMQPYRLEMGTRLSTRRGKDLYAFWGARISEALNEAVAGHKTPLIVNLASEEYARAIQPKALKADMLHIVFKEGTGDAAKIVGLFAKRARGLMADYIIRERIIEPDPLKQFDSEGYRYAPGASSDNRWVFWRKNVKKV